MRHIKKILLVISLLIPTLCYADIVVITHPDNTEKLSQADVRQIFLGKRKAFADGEAIEMFDLPDGSDEKVSFTKKVLRKSVSSLNSYWSRMLFSSKGQPPRSLNDAKEVLEAVSTNKNAIAYISSSDVSSNVKVVLTVSEQ